jgi:diguanylate cyclase (GGDEF)-like protein
MDSKPQSLIGRQFSNRNTASAFWKLMYQVAIVAGATHVMFLGLFYGLGATTLAWVNVGSIVLFACSYGLLRVRLNLMAAFLIVAEIIGHAVMAVRAVGWDSGFHYYLLVMVPVVVISQMKVRALKPILISIVFVIYLSLDHAMRDLKPLDQVDARMLSALRYFNIAVTFVLLTYLSNLYLKLVTQAESKLRVLATTDPLTRLLNRRSLQERAEYELVQRKQTDKPLAFVLADIDHFKSINDQYGHAAGDAVLSAVSDVLRLALREQDSVARWGGEEFLILMPNASLDVASNVAERLRRQIAEIDVPYEGAHIRISMTFGVSMHHNEEGFDAPVSRADAALYRGKMAGRNQVVADAT